MDSPEVSSRSPPLRVEDAELLGYAVAAVRQSFVAGLDGVSWSGQERAGDTRCGAVAQAMAVVGRLSALARVVTTTATARIRVATSWLMVWSRSPRASVGTIVPV